MRRALLDRLLISEATEEAGKILLLFPGLRESAGGGFIGGLVAVLMNYPRQVALRAKDPVLGVAAGARFLTIAALVAWCEREVGPLLRRYRDEQRDVDRDVERNVNPEASERLRALTRAWLDRDDPVAQQVSGEGGEAQRLRAEACRAGNEAAMRQRHVEVEEDYRRAGLEPPRIGGIPVTPELARMLGIPIIRAAASE